jgi:phosphoglycolate phosphatase
LSTGNYQFAIRKTVIINNKVKIIEKIKDWLKGLSFKTGVVVMLMCIPFYVLSFVQFSFDFLSVSAKGILWVVLFGLAKTFQYGGLTILGVEGIKRLKQAFKKKKSLS